MKTIKATFEIAILKNGRFSHYELKTIDTGETNIYNAFDVAVANGANPTRNIHLKSE